ncbi:1-acylglycerophosphocholine O-acyltransferase protein [Dioscorea alata]|uniref:1-acylglycerophosphocholine O-acyltransferase protein n=1 Tax=Dioscorea alata TaxID=55571 RepID=A0ACB7WAE3_DIOAL|nr:1-acylglycerophosphocholine O-acyltransferase protein [Dioscorea alata]
MMRWAARAEHLAGLPRKVVFVAVGAFAKVMTTVLNSTHVHNPDTLIRLVRSRPSSVPLLTVSNHMSTLDDPLMWGFKGFPSMDAKLARWVLAAEDICFKNRILSYLFRLGKCIPVTRGGGIYQEHMSEALDVLNGGGWLHTFPEGKVNQEDVPVRRLKWGTASLIVRAPVTPIVLPIVHSGFEKVMPEKAFYGRRPPLPLCMKDIKIIIDGLDEAAQRWLLTSISDQIRTAMEKLRTFEFGRWQIHLAWEPASTITVENLTQFCSF